MQVQISEMGNESGQNFENKNQNISKPSPTIGITKNLQVKNVPRVIRRGGSDWRRKKREI